MAEPRSIEERLSDEWERLVDEVKTPPGESPLKLPRDRRVPLSRLALFAQLEEVKDAFRELRAAIGPEEAGRYVNAGWTLKDLLAHLASWAREFRRDVESAFRGETFGYTIPFVMTVMGPNQWNQVEVDARHDRTLEAIFDELEEETRALQERLLEVDEAVLYRPHPFPFSPTGDSETRWEVPSAVVIAGKCQHDLHHIAQIRAKLALWRRSS